MKSKAWEVYLDCKQIDTVFFDEDMHEDDVEKALIEHDGYNPRIVVHCQADLDLD